MSKIFAIIGGGASGFMAAITAAEFKKADKIILFEKGKTLLNKVKISGGGRCNVTHHVSSVEQLIEYYPRGKNFLKKAFYFFNNKDTMHWFENRNVRLKVEKDNRVFPESNLSESVVQCLLKEALSNNVIIKTEKYVTDVIPKNDKYTIVFRDKSEFESDALMIATGGFQRIQDYSFLDKLKHNIISPIPSLFTFNMPNENTELLMGISIDNVVMKILGTNVISKGSILFTHWGMSGPAVLRASAFAAKLLHEKAYKFQIQINWTPDLSLEDIENLILNAKTKTPNLSIKNWAELKLPKRFWLFILKKAKIEEHTLLINFSKPNLQKLLLQLKSDIYTVSGKSTFKDEFVTCGGININEIFPTTMESKLHSNLFFGGEILDVDGITGGFNFQHAWTSGFLCGKNVFS